MKDITSREDIEQLVDQFYQKVIKDELIGYIFTEVMHLDWKVHIPIMYNFWDSMLLGSANYHGNPMVKHIDLNRKEPLKKEHFERWNALWKETNELLFKGPKSKEAITRAQHISKLMMFKVGVIQS